jgi:hypothetical protein
MRVLSIDCIVHRKRFFLMWVFCRTTGFSKTHPVGLAYQPPASGTFLSEQTSHRQPANSTFLSQNKPALGINHQPNNMLMSERTHRRVRPVAPRTHWAYVSVWVPLPPIHPLTQHTTLFFFFSTHKALARKPVVATLFALRFGLSTPYFCHLSLMQMAVISVVHHASYHSSLYLVG